MVVSASAGDDTMFSLRASSASSRVYRSAVIGSTRVARLEWNDQRDSREKTDEQSDGGAESTACERGHSVQEAANRPRHGDDTHGASRLNPSAIQTPASRSTRAHDGPSTRPERHLHRELPAGAPTAIAANIPA